MNLDPPRLIRHKAREHTNLSGIDYAWLWENVNQEKTKTFIEPISLPQYIWEDLRRHQPNSLEGQVIQARERYYNSLPANKKAEYHIRHNQMRFKSVKPKNRYAKSPSPKMRYAKSPVGKRKSAKSPVPKKRSRKSAKSPSPKMRYQCGK
jgi:hypothetical protein